MYCKIQVCKKKKREKKNCQEENKGGCGEKYERAILFTYSINYLFSFAQQSLNLNSMVENNEVVGMILFASLFGTTIFKFNGC